MPAEAKENGAVSRRARKTTRSGRVLSSKMDKTVVVAVERLVQHKRYKRVVKRTTKLYAHDERNSCKPGDVVTVVESRPMSHLKRWKVRSIVREGKPVFEDRLPAEPEADAGRPAPKRHAAQDKDESAPAAASEESASS